MSPPSPPLMIDTSSPLGLRVHGLLAQAGIAALRGAEARRGDRLLLVDGSPAQLRQAQQVEAQHVIHVQQARTRLRAGHLHEASDPARVSVLAAQLYFEDLLPRIALAAATGRFLSAAPARRAAYVAHEDVAIAAAALLASDVQTCGTLQLTGPAALSHADLAALLGELFSRSIDLEQVTADNLAHELVLRGVDSADAQLSAQLDRALLLELPEAGHDIAKITGMAPLSAAAVFERARGPLLQAAARFKGKVALEPARVPRLAERSAQA